MSQQHPNEREIIESLNTTIHGMMADTPLMLPEPLSAPSHTIPEKTISTPRAEGDDLRDWLTRPADEPPETRSRSNVLTLCIGTMLLSVLAGYGTAQLLNRSFDTAESSGDTWKSATSNAAMSLTWPASDTTPSGTDVLNVKRKVDEYGQSAAKPSNAGLVTLFVNDSDPVLEKKPQPDTEAPESANATEPDTAKFSLAGLAEAEVPEPKEAVDETSVKSEPVPERETVTPQLELASAATGAIPADESNRLFRRAEQLISDGDIAAARLMLRHLAETGDGPAAMKLAQAYDPDWLVDNATGSIPANVDLALRWYTMARDRGQEGAAERMDILEAAQ